MTDKPGQPAASPNFQVPQFDGHVDVGYFITCLKKQLKLMSEPKGQPFYISEKPSKKPPKAVVKQLTCQHICSSSSQIWPVTQRSTLQTWLSKMRAHSSITRTSFGSGEADPSCTQKLAGSKPSRYGAGHILQRFRTPKLQKNLLTIQVATLEDAVRAGNEFLQVKMAGGRPNSNIRQMAKPSLPTNREMRGKLLQTRFSNWLTKTNFSKLNFLMLLPREEKGSRKNHGNQKGKLASNPAQEQKASYHESTDSGIKQGSQQQLRLLLAKGHPTHNSCRQDRLKTTLQQPPSMTADPALVTRRTTPVGSEVSSSRFQASRPPGAKIVIDQLGTVQIDNTITYRRTDSAID